MTGAFAWPVYCADREFECCGEPFAVGMPIDLHVPAMGGLSPYLPAEANAMLLAVEPA